MPEEEKSLRPRWIPPWLWQWRWWTLGTLFILVWWLVPPLLYRHTGTTNEAKLKAITDTRTALLAGLVGVGALLTFWLNSRAYRIAARTAEITAQTFELSEQGHITDRYTKAIEQLGSDKRDVRLGGIYALERLAQDSPQRDHPTVVEVLGAFVREGGRRHGTQPPRQGMAGEVAEKPNPTAPGADTKSQPATDIQAALSVLGRLPQRPKVSRGDLTDAEAAGARLDGAKLSGAQLGGVNLSDAWLRGADLSGARLDRADLSGAQLGAAHLTDARLDGADLRQARGLTQPRLDLARGDAKTQLPPGLEPPASWATAPPASPGSASPSA